MRLIKPSFEIYDQSPGIEGIYKQIERVGRTCYKSEDKITEESAKPFVKRMINSRHGAMLEHGTVYLIIPCEFCGNQYNPDWKNSKYEHNKYSKVKREYVKNIHNYADFITTNLRVLVENNWLNDLEYLCEPTEHHERRITVRFVCDRGVSHEYVRHRVFSFAQESTRYCNYSKDKFGNELTFIIPCWLDIPEGEAYFHNGINFRVGANKENVFGESVNPRAWTRSNDWREVNSFLFAMETAESQYLYLLKSGWKLQEARAVLPNALKTELIMTGFVSDWKHFFDLRALGTTGAPHPQAKELAKPLMKEFERRNLLCITQ